MKEKEEVMEKYKDTMTSGRSTAFGEEKKGNVFSIAHSNLPYAVFSPE